MDHHDYLGRLSEIDGLSPDQRIATLRLLAGQPSLEAVIGLLEERIGAARSCSIPDDHISPRRSAFSWQDRF